MPAGGRRDPEARQARDVMAFGQEFGRALSDGRIVGRAEPFAKVFPSSRAVKRSVGLMAWGVLEDIALDAQLDQCGRLVAETSVRQIAANLGLGKNTVNRHLTAAPAARSPRPSGALAWLRRLTSRWWRVATTAPRSGEHCDQSANSPRATDQRNREEEAGQDKCAGQRGGAGEGV